MQAGKLRHRLQLLAPVVSLDAAGGSRTSYTEGPIVFGRIEPLSGQERWVAQQVRADVSHRITLRYRGVIEHGYRIKWQGRVFDLGPAVDEDERHFSLVFDAIEVRGAEGRD